MITGIITAPRATPYLHKSLDSYYRNTPFPVPHVFAEPGSKRPDACDMYWHQNEETLSGFFNWTNAAHWLLANFDDKHILICEDDIFWRDGFDNLDYPDVDVVTFYTSLPNAPPLKGWQPITYGFYGFCGALALLFKRKALEEILKYRHMINKSRSRHLDTMIGKSIVKTGHKLYCHSPTRVLHLGEVSTILAKDSKAHDSPARQPHL